MQGQTAPQQQTEPTPTTTQPTSRFIPVANQTPEQNVATGFADTDFQRAIDLGGQVERDPSTGIGGIEDFRAVRDRQLRERERLQGLAGGGRMTSHMAIVGERGPEMLIQTKDGVQVIPNELLADDAVKKADKAGVTRFQFGGIFGEGDVSQGEVVSLARQFSPPAVNALLGDQEIPDLRFPFSLPTPRQLGRLTPGETEALNTRLAAEFNTTLGDVVHAQRERFLGNPRSRGRARLVN